MNCQAATDSNRFKIFTIRPEAPSGTAQGLTSAGSNRFTEIQKCHNSIKRTVYCDYLVHHHHGCWHRDTTSTRLIVGCAFSQHARTSPLKLFLIQSRIKVVGADSVSVSSATTATSTSRNQERNTSHPRRARR